MKKFILIFVLSAFSIGVFAQTDVYLRDKYLRSESYYPVLQASQFDWGDTFWEDVYIPIYSTFFNHDSLADFKALKSGKVLAFEDGEDDIIYFNVKIPQSYDTGSIVKISLDAAYPAADTGKIKWVLTYSWQDEGAAFPNATTLTKIDSATRVQYGHSRIDLSASVAGTLREGGGTLLCSLKRDGDATANTDTYENDAYLAGIMVHYQIRRPGSPEVK